MKSVLSASAGAGRASRAARLTGPSVQKLGTALDRLGVRKGGKLMRAAVVLFGKAFMPH